MKLTFATPQGEMPIFDPRLLPDTAAQVARNMDKRRGTFAPARSPLAVANTPNVASPSSLYRYPSGNNGDGFWMVWGSSAIVNVVKSPLAEDAYHRIYWTGDGAPKMGSVSEVTSGPGPYPSTSFDLGIPAPAGLVDTRIPAGRPSPAEYPETAVRATYTCTLVSRFGEEGPPSAPSHAAERWDQVEGAPASGHIDVLLPHLPGGAHDIVSKRIYRAELAGVFQLVATVPVSTSVFTDTVPSDNLGASMVSTTWDMPNPNMVGLTAMDGGFMAGFFDNTLCFSEAYTPHAWPVDYRIAFEDDIVGIVAVTGGLVVATNGKPRIVSGSSPAAMAERILDEDQPCLSRRSMVDMGEYALYAGARGLVAVGGAEATVVTETVMTEEQWQALRPETIHAYRYHGKYLGFYAGGSFIFTPGEGFDFYDIEATGGWYDAQRNQLLVIQGSQIKAWGEGSKMSMRWRSKIHEKPMGLSLSTGKLIAYDYPVSLKVYADGQLFHSQDITGPRPFRLPPGTPHLREIEVEITGTAEVTSIQLATSGQELV